MRVRHHPRLEPGSIPWRWTLPAAALGMAAAAASSAGAAPATRPPNADVAAQAAGFGHPYRLRSSAGGYVTDRTHVGAVQVVLFGYTSCPDICPGGLANVAAAVTRLGASGGAVRTLFISVDPRRDTPSRLRGYVAAFGPDAAGLTGSAGEVAAAARAFHVQYAVGSGKGDYPVTHSGLIFLVDRTGRTVAALPPMTPPDLIAARLRPLVAPGLSEAGRAAPPNASPRPRARG